MSDRKHHHAKEEQKHRRRKKEKQRQHRLEARKSRRHNRKRDRQGGTKYLRWLLESAATMTGPFADGADDRVKKKVKKRTLPPHLAQVWQAADFENGVTPVH